MLSVRKYFDPGLLVAIGIATLAVMPLITRPSMPTMTDAEMHIYRVAEVELLVAQGAIYPRWAPDFYFGYGYPVFNFYSPLSYHLAAYYGMLTGLGAVAGTKFVLVLTAYLGATGMYLFGRDRWGALAGVVSSAAFAYAPYILYIDPHARGDVPEAFALGIAPLIMWSFDRLRRTGSYRHLALAAMLLAALILSHPLMALVVYGFLLAFLAWETFVSPLVPQKYLGPEPRRYVPQLATAILLGLGLSAFYWLPAGIERNAVQLHNVAGPGYFDFHNYFISLTELFSASRLLDLGATEPRFLFNLGLAQWVLAAAGALTVFSSRLRRLDTFFFLFAAIAFIYLITQASVNVWEAIPIMSFFQFPTRFLGPTALAFAPLAGIAVRWAERFDGEKVVKAVSMSAVIIMALTAMPLLFPPAWGEFGEVDPLRMIAVEVQGRALGTTSANDFLPKDVSLVPSGQLSVLESYRHEDGIIDRVNRAALPAGAVVNNAEQRPFYDRYIVYSEEDFVFRLFLFYFPGWVARVDGQPVNIEVAQPEGFVTFNVPAGGHVVEVEFVDTLPRRIGWALFGLALAGVAVSVAMAIRNRNETLPFTPMPWPTAALGIAVMACLVGIRFVAEPLGWFRIQSSGENVEVAEYVDVVQMDRGIQLLAYDVDEPEIRVGEALTVTLYWKTKVPVPLNLQVYIHLIGKDDFLYGQSDKLNPADFPTTRWPTDKYVRDQHEIVFGSPPPPGEYRIVVGLWNAGTGERLKVVSPAETFADGLVLPTRVVIIR